MFEGNPNGGRGGTAQFPYTVRGSGGGRAVPKEQEGPSPIMQSLTAVAGLPPQAFNSFSSFAGAGGIQAILSPMLAGNPLLAIGIKLLQSRLMGSGKLDIPDPVPVALVEVKDTAMDIFTLGQSRIAFTDPFSRRDQLARPMRLPRGG